MEYGRFVDAVRQILPYLDADSQVYRELCEAADHMKQAVNSHAWDGKWYVAAFHDDGKTIGGTDDRLFLNTQSWAVLADIADAEKKRILAESLKRPETPFEPLILYPPFEGWDALGTYQCKKNRDDGEWFCILSCLYVFGICAGNGTGRGPPV